MTPPPAMANLLRRSRRTPSRQRLEPVATLASAASALAARMLSGSVNGRGSAVTLIPDPGVESAIREVDEEIHDRQEHAVAQHDRHDHRVIAAGHREHEEPAHARHAKDRLDEE